MQKKNQIMEDDESDQNSNSYKVFQQFEPDNQNDSHFTPLMNQILNIIKNSPNHEISDNTLNGRLPSLTTHTKLEALNFLMENGRISLLQGKGSTVDNPKLFYKYHSADEAQLLMQLSPEEKVIYSLIEESAERGITKKDLGKSKLTTYRITQILNSLEKKNCVESVRGKERKKQVLWVKKGIQVSTDVVGKLWHRNGGFDIDLVQTLMKIAESFIKTVERATIKQVAMHIRTLNKLEEGNSISDEEIKDILEALVYDKKIETIGREPEFNLKGQTAHNLEYKIRKEYSPHQNLLNTPCAFCPLAKECKKDGLINPLSCQYINDWLEL